MFTSFTARLPICIALTAFLAACGTPPAPDGYTRDVNRMTAGAAVISSLGKMCGLKRIERYRDSFVAKMVTEQGVTEAGVERIRTVFQTADSQVNARFSDPAARKAQCTDFPPKQSNIDAGIAGDFTGQI